MTTKDSLIRAGERLFARKGIHGAQVRELNELAGQRNASALHYHFGSRQGLLLAIVERHSSVVDAERARRLGALDDTAGVRDLVDVVVAPLASRLRSPAGRDYLRIVPQLLDGREGSPPALADAFGRLVVQLGGLPVDLRSERLGAMLLAATTLLAVRAVTVERRTKPRLAHDVFVANLVDMATAMLLAPIGTDDRS